MLEFMVIGLVIFIALFVAATKKGISSLGVRTKRMLSVAAKGSQESVLKSVIRFAQQSGYKVVALDEKRGQLVLEEPASLFSWGFFFPVFVSAQQDGSSLIEVGIKSKFSQCGPVVSRSHERFVTGLKAALFE